MSINYMDMSYSESDLSDSTIHPPPRPPTRLTRSNIKAALALITVTALERCGYYTLTSNLPFTLSRWFYFSVSETPMSLSNCPNTSEEYIKFSHLDTLSVVMFMVIFYVICSIFAVLGGWLGDSKLGRYKTLLISFVFYFLGSVVFFCLVFCMVCNSTEPAAHIIPNSLSTGNVSTPTDNIAYQTPPADVTDLGADDTKTIQLMCKFYLVHSPYRIPLQWTLLVLSFLLLGLGYGFCKPNIAPFGADQLKEEGSDHLQVFYFWFYFFTNVGSLVAFGFSFLQTPKSHVVTYMSSYLVPIVGSVICFFILLICSNLFVKNEPSDDTFHTFFLILKEWLASFKIKRHVIAQIGDSRIDLLKKHNGGSFTDEEVDAFVDLWRIMPVLSTMLLYWACYSQFSSLYYIQGIYLTRPSNIPLSAMSLLNPLMILVLVPLLNNVIYPRMERKGKRLHVFTRIQIGFALAALSLISALVIGWEEKLRTTPESNPIEVSYFNPEDGGMHNYITFTVRDMSILWLTPQIFFISLSEVFAIIASMEFVYREAPVHMKSFAMGIYFLVNALGNACAVVLVVAVKYITVTKSFPGGEWICNNLNHGRIYLFFWLLIFLMLLNMLCFWRHSKKFTPDYSNLRFRLVKS